jgi:hypothetical protein
MTVINSLIIFATALFLLPALNKIYLFLFEKNARTRAHKQDKIGILRLLLLGIPLLTLLLSLNNPLMRITTLKNLRYIYGFLFFEAICSWWLPGLLIHYGKTKYPDSYERYKKEFEGSSEKYQIPRPGIFQIIFHGLMFICFLLALKL